MVKKTGFLEFEMSLAVWVAFTSTCRTDTYNWHYTLDLEGLLNSTTLVRVDSFILGSCPPVRLSLYSDIVTTTRRAFNCLNLVTPCNFPEVILGFFLRCRQLFCHLIEGPNWVVLHFEPENVNF
jgi:hypothetical protein